MYQGQCLCGAVKISTHQPIDKISVCHCGMCQRWNGGPGFSVDCHDDVVIEGEEAVTRFASSQWGERAFCQRCGTHLFIICIHRLLTMFLRLYLKKVSMQRWPCKYLLRVNLSTTTLLKKHPC